MELTRKQVVDWFPTLCVACCLATFWRLPMFQMADIDPTAVQFTMRPSSRPPGSSDSGREEGKCQISPPCESTAGYKREPTKPESKPPPSTPAPELAPYQAAQSELELKLATSPLPCDEPSAWPSAET
ncbi:hypothetical protein EDB86DRAFT_2829650 [Lactarius hatsudake]|nr:hypothetical protein EDB86DRAFT_2829650 [Lactarius hatsudake]